MRSLWRLAPLALVFLVACRVPADKPPARPEITGTEPAGFFALASDDTYLPARHTPGTVIISGRGFGADRGTSVVRYGNVDVTDAVVSWSDAALTVSVDSLYAHTLLAGGPVPSDELLLYVSTRSGTAVSDAIGGVAGRMAAESRCLGEVTGAWATVAPTTFDAYIVGAAVSVSATNATVRAHPGGGPVSQAVTQGSGCAEVYVDASSTDLPAMLRAQLEGVPIGEVIAANVPVVHYLGGSGNPSSVTMVGVIRHRDTQAPMRDDGGYTYRVVTYAPDPREGADVPLALDASGKFTITTEVTDPMPDLRFYYRGWLVEWQ